MIISVILDIGDGRIHPAGSDDERRYIRYAAARLAAFSNITWDLGDDLDSFRDEKWAHETGTLLEGWDPYHHLATTHPVHREHQDRGSEWFGFTSIQDWSRNQHALHAGGASVPDTRPAASFLRRTKNTATRITIPSGRRRLRGLGRDAAPDGVGHRNGRRLWNGRRDGPARHGHLARHRRRLDEWPRRRHDDHVRGLWPHGRFLDQLRMVEDGAAR